MKLIYPLKNKPMRHLFKLKWALIFTLIFTYSCSDQDDNPVQPPVTSDLEIQDFIWKSMNYWYYWQEDVTDLADDRFSNEAYERFLSNYSDPQDLFKHLKYDDQDDFSWYIEDVETQANEFRGISESFGVNIKPIIIQVDDSRNAVVYVAYVIPESPADQQGIKRGDLIYKVNGSVLTLDDYNEANELLSPTKTSITLGLGKYQDGAFIPDENEISISAEQLTENPVHYSSIIEENGKKIGYLVYNSFIRTYHQELNNVFTEFKAEGINELVLDLRYNGGGSVLTAAFLASMIDGNQTNGSTFAKLEYNSKRNENEGSTYPFFDEAYLFDKTTGNYTEEDITIDRLNTINRLYVITSNETASASEMIINGLRPFMDVKLIGETTVGKNEGSITVYDSGIPYTNYENKSSDHSVGLQPIVFQIFNSQDENDYDNGFMPNIEIEEAAYASNILPFGDPNEIMLRAALNDISGVSAKSLNLKKVPNNSISKKMKGKKFSTEMYISPSEDGLVK